MRVTVNKNDVASVQTAFERLAREILSLDPGIRWVAMEQAGQEPRWAWLDPDSGRLHVGSTNGGPGDKQMIMPDQAGYNLGGSQANATVHRLLFVVLAYAEVMEIVARLGPDSHISIAADVSVFLGIMSVVYLGHFKLLAEHTPDVPRAFYVVERARGRVSADALRAQSLRQG